MLELEVVGRIPMDTELLRGKPYFRALPDPFPALVLTGPLVHSTGPCTVLPASSGQGTLRRLGQLQPFPSIAQLDARPCMQAWVLLVRMAKAEHARPQQWPQKAACDPPCSVSSCHSGLPCVTGPSPLLP